MAVPMIAGLYPYTRNGVTHPPSVTLQEIPQSLALNSNYRRDLLVLAGDSESAKRLEGFGLNVRRVFDDAPAEIRRDTAHKMKHWMCRWALETYGEFLWIDWDTVQLRDLDEAFWSWCRHAGTPKFIHIPNYWASVNCGIYYANADWLEAMNRSFGAEVSEPNDELLWASVLPGNLHERPEFWWGSRILNIWNKADFPSIKAETYFVHVKHLEWADELKDIRSNAPA
jgi:hypothetical protein